VNRDWGRADAHPPPEVSAFRVSADALEWAVSGKAVSVVISRNGAEVAAGGRSERMPMLEPLTPGDVWTLWAGDQWGRTATVTVTVRVADVSDPLVDHGGSE